MREIKFRAWDGERMVMQPIVFRNGEKFGQPLMQYTGLKDKNGKELFESDIVEHRNFINELLGKYEVRWGQFGFTLWDEKQPDVLSRYITPEQLEIVGNVWES